MMHMGILPVSFFCFWAYADMQTSVHNTRHGLKRGEQAVQNRWKSSLKEEVAMFRGNHIIALLWFC